MGAKELSPAGALGDGGMSATFRRRLWVRVSPGLPSIALPRVSIPTFKSNRTRLCDALLLALQMQPQNPP